MTQILSATQLDIAADLLRQGALVAFPTETVYGLGGDATNGTAVAGIFAAKGRPQFNPLICHVPDLDAAQELAQFDEAALTLARAFWPGPLTLVLPSRGRVSALVSAGLDTVALRVPAHPLAQDLLRQVGRPVAAPSANPSGRISPTTADHVAQGLTGHIAAILDGGACPVGLESTIIGAGGVLLRPGGLDPDQIAQVLGQPLSTAVKGKITAPGQLSSHYAPVQPIRLNVTDPAPQEAFLGFGPSFSPSFGPILGPGQAALNLSPTGDLAEAAANLFDHLHRLDAMGQPIAVAPVPQTGLGLAINDRLRRAAAPRPAPNAPPDIG